MKPARAALAALPPRTPAAPPTSFFPLSSPSLPPPKPPSALWYTSRPSLLSILHSLSSSLTTSRSHLHRSGLLPSVMTPLGKDPSFALALPHPRARKWRSREAMAELVRNGTGLKGGEYRRLTALLGGLEGLLPYAQVADALSASSDDSSSSTPVKLIVDPIGATLNGKKDVQGSGGLTDQLETLLEAFRAVERREGGGERVAGKDRRLGKEDDLGRVMAVGKRKESGARVWIVPSSSASSDSSSTTEGDPVAEGASPLPGQLLVNAIPLPNYFPLPSHRLAVLRPLSLTQSLGAFNVFAIVKGGGLAAQADAIAVGLAKALVEWERLQMAGEEEEGGWRETLKKAKLLERDPRMVERKKTGQPKARKKNTWVKR